MTDDQHRLVIVGGSDAGTAAGMHAHALDPSIEPLVIVADAYPNFSICGLPFYISGETPAWQDLTKTPTGTLGLRQGELVRVKSKEEIQATLDTRNRNRGLMFDVEMLRYCGRTARVKQRIERIIDEHTGKMIKIDSDCVTLEGFVCMADYHRLWTRSVYEYFREVWLDRV